MDYFELLHLKNEPFSNAPDPDFFYASKQHLGCLQKLELSLRLRRGMSLVIGNVGTGKTTLCRQFIRMLAEEESIETYLILDPQYNAPAEFLSTVLSLFEESRPQMNGNPLHLKEKIKQSIFRKGVDEGKNDSANYR